MPTGANVLGYASRVRVAYAQEAFFNTPAALTAATISAITMGAASGTDVTVSVVGATGVYTSASTITFTTAEFNVGDWVTISGNANAVNNGTFQVTAVATHVLTVANPKAAAQASGASNVFTALDAFVTTSAAHGFVVGQRVTISGCNVAGYNSSTTYPTWRVYGVPSPTTAQLLMTPTGQSAGDAGSISVAMVDVRTTGTTLTLTRPNFISEEIRPDREYTDLRLGVYSVKGDVDFELTYVDFMDFLEAALGDTWTFAPTGTAETLVIGTNFRSFTIEVAHLDINQYRLFSGCCVDKMTFSFKPGEIIKGKMTFMGAEMTTSASPYASSYVPYSSNSVMDAFSGVVNEQNTPIAIVTMYDLSIDNQIKPAEVIGNFYPVFMFYGRAKITGSMSVFFLNQNIITQFQNETEFETDITVYGTPTNETLEFTIPRAKFLDSKVDVKNETPVVPAQGWHALLDYRTATQTANDITVGAANGVYTSAAIASFLTAGFLPGDLVTITGSGGTAANLGTFTVTAVTALVLTTNNLASASEADSTSFVFTRVVSNTAMKITRANPVFEN